MERVLLYKKMSEIELKERTKELCREFFRQFEQDSMLFADGSTGTTTETHKVAPSAENHLLPNLP